MELILMLLISAPWLVVSCELSLDTSESENATWEFMKYIGYDEVTVVYMNVYVQSASHENVFHLYQGVEDGETFLSWRWVWARSQGAFIIKLPLDYPLMSLGVLAVATREIDIHLQEDPPGCAQNLKNWQHEIAQVLISDVTKRTGYDASGFAQDGVGLCRSAYTDSHVVGVRRLVGFKCCAWKEETEQWVCDMDYSSGWMVTWFGPLIMVGWMYVIFLVKVVANYLQSRKKSTTSTHNIVEQLKRHVIVQVTRASSRIPLANSPSELLSQYDEIHYLDILAVSRNSQIKLARVVKIMTLFILFGGYYGYIVAGIIYYRSKAVMISEMETTEEVALNVFGHIGWIFAKDTINIRYYGIAELILTCLIPLMLLIIYASERTKYQPKPSRVLPVPEQNETETSASKQIKLPPIVPEPPKMDLPEVVQKVSYENRTGLGRCLHSSPGKALNIICSVIVLLYGIAIGTLHLAYMAYFLLKGALLSMTILATWLLPAGLMCQYLISVFMPLHTLFSFTKSTYFAHVESGSSHLLVTHEDVMFIQRSLLENFYQRYARRQIFNCVLRAMTAISVLIILFVVLYSSGSQALQQNSSSILGVNLVLLLPLLGRTMDPPPLPELEKRTLERAIKEDIALKNKVKEQWKKVKESSLNKTAKNVEGRRQDEGQSSA